MLQNYYRFKRCEDEFDRLANRVMKTFFFDKPYSIVSINQEKEKHNFSTRHWQEIVKDDKTILAYDIHGIDPENLRVTKVVEDGVAYINIQGKTKNDILNCEMEVDTRWMIPYKQFKKPNKKIENGILYIFIEPMKTEEEVETI